MVTDHSSDGDDNDCNDTYDDDNFCNKDKNYLEIYIKNKYKSNDTLFVMAMTTK